MRFENVEINKIVFILMHICRFKKKPYLCNRF